MVVNGTTGMPAYKTERFYYTAYVLSTLGIGDFVPGNDHSRVITGILSFSGFILDHHLIDLSIKYYQCCTF